MPKVKTEKRLFYDSIAKEFDNVMNRYEVNKRLAIIYKHLLTEDLKGKKFLDAGCGTGLFSAEAVKRGADVTSMDIGKELLNQVAKKCKSKRVVGSVMDIPFKDNTFDVVICTEVVEHTDKPEVAVKELCRVVKPGGILILTTPNKFWSFSLPVADLLKVRPYHGIENWVKRNDLSKWLQSNRMEIDQMTGFNIIPYYHPLLQPLITLFDNFSSLLAPVMVNIGVKAEKMPQTKRR